MKSILPGLVVPRSNRLVRRVAGRRSLSRVVALAALSALAAHAAAPAPSGAGGAAAFAAAAPASPAAGSAAKAGFAAPAPQSSGGGSGAAAFAAAAPAVLLSPATPTVPVASAPPAATLMADASTAASSAPAGGPAGMAAGRSAAGEGAPAVAAEPVAGVPPAMLSHLEWRMIGPFRGGRTVAAVGVPGHPDLFYMGVNNGGVWKTDDAGRTWQPIFDDQATQSIGSIAVAPSDPRILYVGSGEGLQRPDLSVGDGIYKSTDGGATWEHLGLRDGQQIPALLIDPHDPDRVFAAVLGHPYGANAERGVFRSTDGGRSWKKVLYRDDNTGAIDLAFDPTDSRTIYAALWAARQAPWEVGGSFAIAGSGLYKSTDGGDTWKPLTQGLPGAAERLGRIGIGVAPSQPSRIYLQVEADARHTGVYRSDDGGASFRRVDDEARVSGRGSDFAEIKADPKNADVVYVCNTSTYRSTDGGVTWTAIKGAPGGDDYHRIWIDPDRPQVLLLGLDQGAAISLNGGRTWSSWYNQPTAQFYHVITDNRFPYWVYGGQQESGSAAVASRGSDGQITFRDWHPVGAEEYGYIAPDPLHPNLIYGGKLSRFDWSTGQVQDVAPEAVRSGKIRYVRTQPLLFSPVDPHILYYAGSVLFKTTDGGQSWQTISPDLTRERPQVPAVLGAFTAVDPEAGRHRGVIYALAPGWFDVNQIWAGTDDGLIHLTRDGGAHWQDVTPAALTPWSKVSILEASHFDAATAYAAINRFRLDDLHPHILRTHDFGKTWQEVVRGLPDNAVVNSVREDLKRRGLLFAGTERGVFVSFDDGDHWQSLRRNLPATAVRDLTLHGDDLIAGTHGRSFWVLDDITSLRQLDAHVLADTPAHLFQPALAYRVRRDLNTDTPLPPDEPAGKNPPDGAILEYLLQAPAASPVTIEIRTAGGQLVRRYASDDRPAPVDPKAYNVPMYWVRPPQPLAAGPGLHRFVWDLRFPPPESLHRDFPISAIGHDTPLEPQGPLVLPGEYQIVLAVAGKTFTRTLTVEMDPRVQAARADLERQSAMAANLMDAIHRDAAALQQIRALHARLSGLDGTVQAAVQKQAADLDTRLAALATGGPGGADDDDDEEADAAPSAADNLTQLNGQLSRLLVAIEGIDAAPTSQQTAAVALLTERLGTVLDHLARLQDQDFLRSAEPQPRHAAASPPGVTPAP